jgi:hypothetical protein
MSPLEHWVTQFAPGACEGDHTTKPAADVWVHPDEEEVRAAIAVI